MKIVVDNMIVMCYIRIMKTITLNELENVEFSGIDMGDYPDFCDAHVCYATWKATGVELTDEELENIDESDVSEQVLQNAAEGDYS